MRHVRSVRYMICQLFVAGNQLSILFVLRNLYFLLYQYRQAEITRVCIFFHRKDISQLYTFLLMVASPVEYCVLKKTYEHIVLEFHTSIYELSTENLIVCLNLVISTQ